MCEREGYKSGRREVTGVAAIPRRKSIWKNARVEYLLPLMDLLTMNYLGDWFCATATTRNSQQRELFCPV